MIRNRIFVAAIVFPMVSCGETGDEPFTEYNPEYCAQVQGTPNFHWEAVSGSSAPCTGIEITDGDIPTATSTGFLSMSGLAVSDVACIGTATYELTLSQDTLSLSGTDTQSNIPMNLVRLPDEDCFVGHWVDGEEDYIGHVWAGAFGIEP